MSQKMDGLPKQERERIQIDLLAIGIVYHERYGDASEQESAEARVPAHLQSYFQQRLAYYRKH